MDAKANHHTMDITIIKKNAIDIDAEINWLEAVITARMNLYFGGETQYKNIFELNPPDLSNSNSLYAQIVQYYQMQYSERLLMILALVPHVKPQVLDVFFIKQEKYDRGFTEFGGVKGANFSGFLPTGETAAFILAPHNIAERIQLLSLFDEEHFFKKHNILQLQVTQTDEPQLSGLIKLSAEYITYFTTGDAKKPDYNIHFPAKLITTPLNWEDLVMQDEGYTDLMEIRDWIQYGDELLEDWGMKKQIKRGFRTLFYGPPGTGKTLSASLLGKVTGHDVYRIDLSMVVSKYIGETEKNLANVFDQAENKNWILFFDEADALFGKRTQASSSNDRYANQEISYLLQRIEDFPGVVILCTNLKANIDEAFSRRFQSMIYFPLPDAASRLKLWHQSFPANIEYEPTVDFKHVAQKYELSGGAIINISRYACLKSIARNSNTILAKDILNGIRREFAKDGKAV